MMATWQDAEKDLAEYTDEFNESEFVPFPTVDAAVEAVMETIGYTFNSYMSNGEEFVLEVARRLEEAIEVKREKFLQEYWADPAPAAPTVPADASDAAKEGG